MFVDCEFINSTFNLLLNSCAEIDANWFYPSIVRLNSNVLKKVFSLIAFCQ